jgi:magnesium-transporting ATPase (P-type)
MVLDILGEKHEIPKKCLFEFDNKRKMMSVIIEEKKDGKTYFKLLCKGADSAVLSRLSTSIDQPFLSANKEHLEEWAKYGLRTLCMAMKIISKEEMDAIVARLTSSSLSADKEKLMEVLMAEVEKDMFLLGCSAVEDRLQDEVPETIARLLEGSRTL